jgi:acetyl-CoA C-acetyltransferase
LTEVVIASAVRTPIGRFQGGFSSVTPQKLGAIAIAEAVRRAKVDPAQVEEVIMGNVVMAGLGQNPARQAAIEAGIPYEAGAMTINKVCGSGLKAICIAANSIRTGEHELIVAGGMESMTRAPYILREARAGYRLNDGVLVDTMVYDGLWDAYNDFHMGNTGEIIAERFGLKREEIDAFAARSHQLAAKATETGMFRDEIIPVEVPQRKGDPVVVDRDEGIRADSTPEGLARLKPAFKKDGVVTAGNASQISDGASAVVVTTAEKAAELGADVLGRIVAYNTSGVEPAQVMYAPVPGVYKILETTGLGMDDFDLVEHNEAFASASLAVQREFGIPDGKFNVHGGAVALGHPIGCSGSRIVTTLLYALKNTGGKRGLATICLGGGNGVTMVLERP